MYQITACNTHAHVHCVTHTDRQTDRYLLSDDIPFTVTIWTNSLHLLYHSWPYLSNNDLNTITMATITRLNRTLFTALPITLVTDNVLIESQLSGGPVIELLQRDLERVDHVTTPAGALVGPVPSHPASSAEEHVEYVHGVVSPGASPT